MKKQYDRVVRNWYKDDHDVARYEFRHGGYHRRVRTFPEMRQNVNDIADQELRDLKYYPRGRRARAFLDPWNDFNRGRTFGKSWKDYTKNSRQWEETQKVKSVDIPHRVAGILRWF